MYKVLMFGNRDWTDPAPIRRELKQLIKRHGASDLLIIEGKAPGADQLAGIQAVRLNVHVVEVGALWETRHRGAGPQRNAVMAALKPDEGIGFADDVSDDRGSHDMIQKLVAAAVPYRIVTTNSSRR